MRPDPQAQLTQAGWFPGRRVDPEAASAALTAEGYRPWPALVAFLAEFSGLSIRSDHRQGLWIDAARAVAEVDVGWSQAYEELAGCALAPVGGQSHLTVYLGADGALWGGYDRLFGRLGDTLPVVVDRLLNHEHPEQLNLVVPD